MRPLRWELYDVTGISPQSRTVAQLLKGFASSGTLYPPLNRTLREPLPRSRVSLRLIRVYILEIKTARTLSDSVRPEASARAVRSSSVERSSCIIGEFFIRIHGKCFGHYMART